MNLRATTYIMLLLGCYLAFASCKQLPEAETENDRLLATVFNRSLYLSELDGMIPEGASQEDSALIINAFTERWVRENVLMHEAEINIPQDLNIDRLVRDYRASLVKHNYEQILIELELDSIIPTSELLEFYEKNKEQYKLESPIVRCHFIKMPLDAPNNDNLKTWWKSGTEEDFVKIVDYASNHATIHLLEDSLWYRVEDIAVELPNNALTANNVNTKKEISQEDEYFLYLFLRYDLIKKGEYAPLAFVREQASRAILHQRKLKLLENKREEMYERELAKNNIKIFTK